MAAPDLTVRTPVWRQQVVVLAVLLAVAAAGWIAIALEASDDSMEMVGDPGAAMDTAGATAEGDGMAGMAGMEMGPAEGSAAGAVGATAVPDLSMGGEAAPFLASWTAMMAAMMLPAAAPMVLLYARTQPGKPANVGLFTGSYLALWVAFGVGAFLVAVGLEEMIGRSSVVARNWGRATGGLIVAAGLYQFTSLKAFCLSKCRSPLAFILSSWRDGPGGALQMGLRHGLYCAGCCWLIFVIVVPIGIMNVAAMLVVALAIFGEKVLPRPVAWRRVTGAALVVYGLAVVLRPSLLPTVA